MKIHSFFAIILLSLLPVFSFLTSRVYEDQTNRFRFELKKTTYNDYELLNYTQLKIEFYVQNDYHFNIKEVILDIDLYHEGVLVDSVTETMKVEVLNNSYIYSEHSMFKPNVQFDEIRLTDVRVTHYGFFHSYQPSIYFALLYNFILLFGIYILTKHKYLTFSEFKDFIVDHKWLTILVTIIIPLVILLISYIGRYHLLLSIYGWVYYIVTLLCLPLVYAIVFVYHVITDNKL